MLCVPRSWAASPCVIERMIAIAVGDLGQLRNRLADDFAGVRLDRTHLAAIFDRRVRLGIERFLVGHSTGQKDVNHAVCLGLDKIVMLLLGLRLPEFQEIGEGQPQAAHGTDSQKVTTAQTIALASHTKFSLHLIRYGSLGEHTGRLSWRDAGPCETPLRENHLRSHHRIHKR